VDWACLVALSDIQSRNNLDEILELHRLHDTGIDAELVAVPNIRSAPTVKICMTPLASVAMLEKLAC
jgi:hypothetical protein